MDQEQTFADQPRGIAGEDARVAPVHPQEEEPEMDEDGVTPVEKDTEGDHPELQD